MNPETPTHPPHSAPERSTSDDARPLTIRRLKWIAFAASLGFVVVLETARQALYPYLSEWGGNLLLDVLRLRRHALLPGRRLRRDRAHPLAARAQEPGALGAAPGGLLVFSELSEEVVLQKVVDQARRLIATKYGALSVLAEGGGILSFVTSGIDPAERRAHRLAAVGRGVLGVTLRHGHSLRINERLPVIRRAPGFRRITRR